MSQLISLDESIEKIEEEYQEITQMDSRGAGRVNPTQNAYRDDAVSVSATLEPANDQFDSSAAQHTSADTNK